MIFALTPKSWHPPHDFYDDNATQIALLGPAFERFSIILENYVQKLPSISRPCTGREQD